MERKIDILWSGSLLVICICTFAVTVLRMLEIELSDFVRILACVVELLAMAVLVYASVKRMRRNRKK